MKNIKKGLLLALAFTMSMTLFAACGGDGGNGGSGDGGNGGSGDGGDNVQGEQLADAMAWAQAWNDSISSTNATATFSFTIEDREGALFQKEEASGTYKVADSKFYGYMTGRESWNNGDGDVGDESHVEEWYVGAVDGVWYEWDKDVETNAWLKEDFYVTEDMSAANYTTVYGVMYELEVPYEPFYTEYESFTYTDGAYVLTMSQGSFTRTASLKFANGKLASYEMIVLANEDGQTFSGKMQIVFTYGNTTIGELPDQGDVDGGDSSETIEDSSEIVENSSEIGGDEVKGEVLADEAAWLQALDETAATTNVTIALSFKTEYRMGNDYVLMNSNGTLKIADNKTHMLMNNKVEGNNEEILEGFLEIMQVSSTNEMYLGVVDGEVQEWFKDDDGAWEQGRPMDDYVGTLGVVLEGIFDFSFDEILYESYSYFELVEDTYVFELESESLEVKFVGGKLYSILMKDVFAGEVEGEPDSTAEMTFTFTYGNTTVGDLPGQEDVEDNDNSEVIEDSSEIVENSSEIIDDNSSEIGGDEIVTPGEEIALPEKFTVQVAPTDVVTQAEWEEAVRASAAATNVRIYCLYEGRYQSWQSIADGKGAHRVENADGSVMYSYAGKVDGNFYTWISVDGENWTCQQVEEVPLTGAAFFTADMVNLLAYSNAVYDEQRGLYTVTGTYMGNEMIIEVIINGGKIVSINGVENLPGLYQLSYGDAYVGELPPVMENNGGSGNSGTTTDKEDNMTGDNGGMPENNNGNNDNNGGNGTDAGDHDPQPSDKVTDNG